MKLALILLQATENINWMQVLSIKDVSAAAILIGIIVYFYKQNKSLENKVDDYIRQKDEDNKKYYELVIQVNKTLDETNRIMQRLEKVLDRKLE